MLYTSTAPLKKRDQTACQVSDRVQPVCNFQLFYTLPMANAGRPNVLELDHRPGKSITVPPSTDSAQARSSPVSLHVWAVITT
jgi:hypothetical protein